MDDADRVQEKVKDIKEENPIGLGDQVGWEKRKNRRSVDRKGD